MFSDMAEGLVYFCNREVSVTAGTSASFDDPLANIKINVLDLHQPVNPNIVLFVCQK